MCVFDCMGMCLTVQVSFTVWVCVLDCMGVTLYGCVLDCMGYVCLTVWV